MVARSTVTCQTDQWQRDLAGAYRDIDALLDALRLSRTQIPDLDPEPSPFGILVTRSFAACMTPGDPTDPLLRQVLPLSAERILSPGFLSDPVGDIDATRVPGLLQKYHGRALMIVTGACAVHCRYCFRRHFPYADVGPTTERWNAALAHIAADDSLREIVLSGGDPLMMADGQIADLVERLNGIGHLRRLRIHTRLPVVLPSRVSDGLCEALTRGHLGTIVVVHANHPRELDASASTALARLRNAGIQLLNQSVLLRGVNDDPAVLAELSERLFDCGVIPYYIHQLDPVVGAGRFQVSDDRARMLLDNLRARISGYLVPRLVREIQGEGSKTWLG
ncbi:EF-P beta-lysylation protein EpmB [Thiocystis violacea]|uniref:EF-P beta-lysylation protein EpmB n=1 Tax=Thiocystis violacea TaxID=13725 RepID=UPI00190509DA|nr:EF-P beta-lysylation protein EpmB [Thiocystis violacea]MBK1721992.1 EF-P beta-lysylation protein EpmB [Thiocystis violacea]